MQKLRNLYVLVGFLTAALVAYVSLKALDLPDGFGRLGVFFGSVLVGVLVGYLLRPRKSLNDKAAAVNND